MKIKYLIFKEFPPLFPPHDDIATFCLSETLSEETLGAERRSLLHNETAEIVDREIICSLKRKLEASGSCRECWVFENILTLD